MAATLPASPFSDDKKMERSDPKGGPPHRRQSLPWADAVFSLLTHGAAWLTLALLAGIIVSLVIGAAPAIEEFGLGFLTSAEWDPVQEKFGGLVMIYGTLPAEPMIIGWMWVWKIGTNTNRPHMP